MTRAGSSGFHCYPGTLYFFRSLARSPGPTAPFRRSNVSARTALFRDGMSIELMSKRFTSDTKADKDAQPLGTKMQLVRTMSHHG